MASGIPMSDLESREDWILLLNCFFFGCARHDYRPLVELLQGTQSVPRPRFLHVFF